MKAFLSIHTKSLRSKEITKYLIKGRNFLVEKASCENEAFRNKYPSPKALKKYFNENGRSIPN